MLWISSDWNLRTVLHPNEQRYQLAPNTDLPHNKKGRQTEDGNLVFYSRHLLFQMNLIQARQKDRLTSWVSSNKKHLLVPNSPSVFFHIWERTLKWTTFVENISFHNWLVQNSIKWYWSGMCLFFIQTTFIFGFKKVCLLKAAVYSCGFCQTRCLDPWKQQITPSRIKNYTATTLITFLGNQTTEEWACSSKKICSCIVNLFLSILRTARSSSIIYSYYIEPLC